MLNQREVDIHNAGDSALTSGNSASHGNCRSHGSYCLCGARHGKAGGERMEEAVPARAIELMEYLHVKLDAHFGQLQAQRAQLDLITPVFALEHDLSEADLSLLTTAVQSAMQQGFDRRFQKFWLPIVVYAAEVGYDYVGDEYWPSFEEAARAPGWATQNNRRLIKAYFVRYAERYGGARPTGAWAEHFRIICWPVTHAVLPTYLQRYLAQLMYEYKTGLTPTLLDDPTELGVRLASRTAAYTERFRIFCQNTSLLGQVVAALLAGEDEPSPYLIGSTLHRIVEGLSKESQSRAWLHESRAYAHQVRRRQQSRDSDSHRQSKPRRPQTTDPRLLLRRGAAGWVPVAALPDLSPLALKFPQVTDELRTRQAVIAGVGRRLVPGRLLDLGQEVTLATWPPADQPFIQLVRGPEDVNCLLATQCVITPGPSWLFHLRADAPAVQVKGNIVRPGHAYCLVNRADGRAVPEGSWITKTHIAADGVRAYELTVPSVVGEPEIAALAGLGLSVATEVRIRPVGLVAAAWDAESAAEWLAGDPAIIGVRSERAPSRLMVTIDNCPYLFSWPEQRPETFIELDDLEIGSHQIVVSLLPAAGEAPLATTTLQVTVRDPQIRPENATRGEGVRILASPARPSLHELWDDRASLTIEGPAGTRAQFSLTLRDARGEKLATLPRTVKLPLDADAWRTFARQELRRNEFGSRYDTAESCDISVSRSGLGYASMHVERGFQPLRWVIGRRDRAPVARLIDRTDGGETHVEFFAFETPTEGIPQALETVIEVPGQGGLVRAAAGDAVAAVILPPDRNQMLAARRIRPDVPTGRRTVAEVVRLVERHAIWNEAALPADPFAEHQRDLVLRVITRQLVSLVADSYKWGRLERRLDFDQLIDHLDELQDLVGNSPRQQAMAKKIGGSLWRWAEKPSEMATGFAEAIRPVAVRSGLTDKRNFIPFLLRLARVPGKLASWSSDDRTALIDAILRTPELMRAARFTVLGMQAFAAESAAQQSTGDTG